MRNDGKESMWVCAAATLEDAKAILKKLVAEKRAEYLIWDFDAGDIVARAEPPRD